MTPEDLKNTFLLTHVKLKEDFGSLDDFPYELANEDEYRAAKGAIPEFRNMRGKEGGPQLIAYTVDYLLDVLRHRIPDVGRLISTARTHSTTMCST